MRREGPEEKEVKVGNPLAPCLQGYLELVMCLLSRSRLCSNHPPAGFIKSRDCSHEVTPPSPVVPHTPLCKQFWLLLSTSAGLALLQASHRQLQWSHNLFQHVASHIHSQSILNFVRLILLKSKIISCITLFQTLEGICVLFKVQVKVLTVSYGALLDLTFTSMILPPVSVPWLTPSLLPLQASTLLLP